MVKYIIAEQLVGKEIITNDGFLLGSFVDATFDETTGKIEKIIVDAADSDIVKKKFEVKEGKIEIPYSGVLAVNDFIVVDSRSLSS